MTNWKNDIQEIIQFIEASKIGQQSEDATICISRVTAITEENYLNDRAEALKSAFYNKKDVDVRKAFEKLAAYCNDNNKACEECPICKYCNTYISEFREAVNKDNPRMIDLFCGAGGLSLGFNQEGFVTVLANDIEPVCVDTYAHNHPETPRGRIILGDIKSEILDCLNERFAHINADIIVGGPPCQGFSMANRQRLIDDPRNKLYKYFVEIVDKIKPPFFVMENVKGMLGVKDQVIEDFETIGYETRAKILNARDFGVPQNRERLIYIGNCLGIDNDCIFSDIMELSKSIPNTVLGDALYGLRPLEASRKKNATDEDSWASGGKIEHDDIGLSNYYIDYINNGKKYSLVLNHKARYNNDRDIEIFGRLNPGDKSTDPKIADIMPYSRRNDIFKDKYFKLEADKICKTITAHMKFDCNMYIHPSQARGLTPREAARVQSYPDDYYFRGAYTKTYMQIGNSVPPLLGRAIASCIKQYL